MGGSGSGRGGGRPTIGRTQSNVLSIQLLRNFLRLGHSGFRVTFRSYTDEFAVDGVVDTHGAPHIWLFHTTRCDLRKLMAYEVRLERTFPSLGGARWWFLCPETGRRAAKLYLPLGGRRFLSREAYGLVHDTRQMSKAHRQSRRISRIAAKMGAPACDFSAPPNKPLQDAVAHL